MRHVYEVLKEKEIAIERLRREIDALRFACQMLQGEDDSAPDDSHGEHSSTELEDKTGLLARIDERETALARIRARLGSTQPKSAHGKAAALIQFKEAAVGASRVIWTRFLDFRARKAQPERKTIRYLFERSGRSSAA